MVNGNYVLYGDRPSSESEIVDDHVQTRTNERKNRRKINRTANDLQRTLNMAQLDNDTDSVKYEKKVKEPRLLRYVSTSDVEENFVNEKYETYDLKPTEERPRRYNFQKKPKNPADGSVNYAHSRSSSSCSSPNGNLPTISEHGEQYGTYRVRSAPNPNVGDIINGYESKIDKYFTKPKEGKEFAIKVKYKGSHPDSLYRVPTSSGVGSDRMARILRVLRWPVALVAICIALAVFVYFLMPDSMDRGLIAANDTQWQRARASSTRGSHGKDHSSKPGAPPYGTNTPEIDFYDADIEKVDFSSIIDSITETNQRNLPAEPIYPKHIELEVQYGNEKSDSEKLRSAKQLDQSSISPQDTTLKPHITQKPEKPLAVYFKEGHAEITTTTESITRAETINEFTNYGDKHSTKTTEEVTKSHGSVYKEPSLKVKPLDVKQYLVTEPQVEPDFFPHPAKLNFTSGHSNLFGLSIEDAEKMRSTTSSSLYNTRVSPTLPTWRDGDDATTKKYPVNVNNEVPQCRSTRQPVCRGVLPYDLAGSPATVAGVDVTILLPQIEYLVSTNCSDRVKHFVCALLEPECSPAAYPPKLPCYNLCKAIVDSCEGYIPGEMSRAFSCSQYAHTDCVAARAPCHPREFTCKDQTCVPRDWVCDGSYDCPYGEDETPCTQCDKNEFRCNTGICIQKRWMCDGYADCPGGEDEGESCDRVSGDEAGEESAGSAPAPAVRRPSRLPADVRQANKQKTGDIESQELLITSDTSNVYKRNYTRRPSPSRLTPYSRSKLLTSTTVKTEQNPEVVTRKFPRQKPTAKPTQKPAIADSQEDINLGDLGFIEEVKKTTREESKRPEPKTQPRMNLGTRPKAQVSPTKLDKSINRLEKVINGAALMQKAMAEEEVLDSPELNNTSIDVPEKESINASVAMARGPKASGSGSISAHASPCPSGELRCVDGRCITLSQLCDGTIDCTDHADEDNCYT